MKKINLNQIFENNKETTSGSVIARSHNHQESVCDFIREHDAIVGCSMYLTNKKIIETILETRTPISIIVDKCSMRKIFDEYDFLKDKLTSDYEEFEIIKHKVVYQTGIFSHEEHSVVVSPDCAVRYFGLIKSNQYLHHEFIVGCDIDGDKVTPVKVLTGSYNFSENSNLCRENILIINDDEIAKHFFEEWETAFVLSEKDCEDNEFSPDLLSHSDYIKIKKQIEEEEEHLNYLIKYNEGKDTVDQ
ncbi:hypothetical protein [Vibrio alginolyticus]|uniref:hypothetical protein n=1 Tax=Vibrio alginolyticus TaxID=663 RepID=UPI001BD3C9F9|nr:hypothetical protein [Vibrio alginolyticus]MBT0016746.1 hypothetical protein [Vibrio alginolyticus]